jgi:hypothetical protein
MGRNKVPPLPRTAQRRRQQLDAGKARQHPGADAEGLQTMRTLARNMAFLVKSIALGREKYGLPEREEPLRTHFIR